MNSIFLRLNFHTISWLIKAQSNDAKNTTVKADYRRSKIDNPTLFYLFLFAGNTTSTFPHSFYNSAVSAKQ